MVQLVEQLLAHDGGHRGALVLEPEGCIKYVLGKYSGGIRGVRGVYEGCIRGVSGEL